MPFASTVSRRRKLCLPLPSPYGMWSVGKEILKVGENSCEKVAWPAECTKRRAAGRRMEGGGERARFLGTGAGIELSGA